MEYRGFNVFWDGHGAVRVEDDGFTVAVDPVSEVSPGFEADLVLITSGDPGHYEPGTVENVSHGSTCVVLPDEVENRPGVNDIEYIRKGELLDIFGVEIEGVPSSEGVGYRFVMRDNAFYVSGDTAELESPSRMEGKVDLAFLAIAGEMEFKEAVKMAVRIKPSKAVPYLYGKPFRKDEGEPRKFQVEAEDRNIETELLTPETE